VGKISRRSFLKEGPLVVAAATTLDGLTLAQSSTPAQTNIGHLPPPNRILQPVPPIDSRFSPGSWQSAICFPDDPVKSLVGEKGDLRLGFLGAGGLDDFSMVIEFSLACMFPGKIVRQELESAQIPIIRTFYDYSTATMTLTAFASNLAEEGRVDNVIMEVKPKSKDSVSFLPKMTFKSLYQLQPRQDSGFVIVGQKEQPASVVACFHGEISGEENRDREMSLYLQEAEAELSKPYRCFLRFPQAGQGIDALRAMFSQPGEVLKSTQQFWKQWKPFSDEVNALLPGRHQQFLLACARNIQQARELKQGKLTFQVGPTVYRGLWVVDGHFILEAARYLGYNKEAQQGLEATWARQEPDGGIFAGGGREHWKDTGIAMFTLVRQAELSQDWSYFRQLQPEILRAVGFLKNLSTQARREDGPMGRYGLLAQGFGDGGLGGGVRPEFTNTLWVLAGLKALVESAETQSVQGFDETRQFFKQLRDNFFAAARLEMRRHLGGFDYLPMLLKEDPEWQIASPKQGPKPQMAQWALSHAIYPGLLFSPSDPVVQGHVALMQACTQEDVPIETGWIHHGGLWNYSAAFVAHVYLWAGLADWARKTFVGFLNHASPLHCWREEQPLQKSLQARYVGDMPHNWASAECVLFLRHMLALEDGRHLRLLEGIGDYELNSGEPMQLTHSPTRFGCISLKLEPTGASRGWKMVYQRETGPAPRTLQLPFQLGSKGILQKITGAANRQKREKILVDPASSRWTATWG
jgi:hypothetical protein